LYTLNTVAIVGYNGGMELYGQPLDTRSIDHISDDDETACNLSELGTIQVVPMSSRCSKAAKAWKDLMERHYCLGASRLRGADIRYHAQTEDWQWIGALSFSASTRRLKDRDQWIGWSEKGRRAHLQLVVGDSRFLILPRVNVPYLASHVVGSALARLADDWYTRYGYRSALVETFVDPVRFNGTCYREANWRKIGRTGDRTYRPGQSGCAPFIRERSTRFQT
jgi:hypothetical protein